jgi:hypothetical protein
MGEVVPIRTPEGDKKRASETYGLDPAFEAVVAYYVACRPRFWGMLGGALDPRGLANPHVKLIVEAVAAIAKDTGRGPDSSTIVIQRLRRWMADGKVTQDQILAAGELLDGVEDSGPPGEAGVLAELAPVLRRRIEREGVEEALAEFSRKGDPTKALRKVERAAKIGVSDISLGTMLGRQSLDQIERLKNVQRLRTGSLELDDAISLGAMRATLSMFIADSGGGKSMGLVQVAGAAACQGFNVALATTELPEPIITARLKANLTAVPIDAILSDPYGCGVLEKLERFQNSPGFGKVAVREFAGKASTVADLAEWVSDLEESTGEPFDVLVCDYADKLSSRSTGKHDSTYTTQGNVYDELFNWARDNRKWAWTGSQSQGRDAAKDKIIDLSDVADSIGKVRAADLVITLNARDGGESNVAFIAKNRLGKKGGIVGPLPTEFYVARLFPIDPRPRR